MWCRMFDGRRAGAAAAAIALLAASIAAAMLGLPAAPALAGRVRPIPPTLPATPEPPVPPSGSLYDPGRFAGLASDLRARHVGDLLTIRLVERTRALKRSSARSGRESDNRIGLPDVFPFNRVPAGALAGGSAQDFSGSGEARQNNELFGEITVTVAEVLPGGVLRVAGEKRLMLNRGEEHLQLQGLVRAQDVGFDNSVASTRIADARIRFGGTGQVADNSKQGWLARFFAKLSPL